MYKIRNMKRITKSIAIVLLALCAFTGESSAQSNNDNRPYNLQKAYDILQESRDEDQALKLLGEQLESTPKNTECWMLMCRIYRNRKEYGMAMSCVNEAIKVNNPKKTDYRNSLLYWWKASIYDNLDEKNLQVEWLNKALTAARKDNKDNVPDISFDLAQAYYDIKNYSAADAVYRQMVKEDETDVAAMVGLARNMIDRGDYVGAVQILNKCQKYNSDYAGTYKFRCLAYDKMGQTDKAIDDVITWLEKDDHADMSTALNVQKKHSSYAHAKIKDMMKSSENKIIWQVNDVALYEQDRDFVKTIKGLDVIEQEYGKDGVIYAKRADCYDELGLIDRALSDIDAAIAMEDDYTNNCSKASMLRAAGRYEEAIKVLDRAIDLEPMYAFAYYAKGWCYELMGDDDRAFEMYNLGIDLDKTYAYTFLMRGEMYRKRGDAELAKADFETILQIDTIANSGSCRHYALHFLGRDQEADEWMQKMIDDEPANVGNYYDKACLYARMGRLDEAVKALGTALEMGYCKFAHIEHDDDMDAIRDRDDFRALISKYTSKLAERISELSADCHEPKEEHITEVPISRHAGGTFDVDCCVNGLQLSMIFDTGASDVTISKVEADFMLKNKYLSKDDIKGKRYYQIADGGISEGTVITLKEVKIGDAVLRNVDASVVKSQRASLLLGQSVLEKFGTFTVDNNNNKLIIRH